MGTPGGVGFNFKPLTYSCAQNKPIGSHIMKQNADFKEGISQP